MKFLPKLVAITLLLLNLSVNASFSIPTAKAATGILPGGEDSVADHLTSGQCSQLVVLWDEAYAATGYSGMPDTQSIEGDAYTSDQMLTCALKSGNMHFWMVPYFVNYALEFVITISGVIVVLMIVVGGYYYIYGAVTDDKEKGKTIIMYAIGGYVLVLTSWFIVNAVLLAVTQ